jgi:hypothetical protein
MLKASCLAGGLQGLDEAAMSELVRVGLGLDIKFWINTSVVREAATERPGVVSQKEKTSGVFAERGRR